jgi:hypothetical protein
VSIANLRSKQGGINFTPLVFSLPNAKKKIPYGWVVPNYLLNCWSDWAKKFFTKTRENVYLGILILKFRGNTIGLRP